MTVRENQTTQTKATYQHMHGVNIAKRPKQAAGNKSFFSKLKNLTALSIYIFLAFIFFT